MLLLSPLLVMLLVAQSGAAPVAASQDPHDPAECTRVPPVELPADPAPSRAVDAGEPDQPGYVADFLRTARGQAIGLRDERGGIAIGKLLQVEGTRAIVRVRGIDYVVPTQHIEQVVTKGDSPWDGVVKGTVVGLAFWAMIVAQGDTGLDTVEDNPDDFTLADTVGMITSFAAIGFVVDYLHAGEQTIYVAPMPAHAARTGRTLQPNAAGRRFALRFRVSF